MCRLYCDFLLVLGCPRASGFIVHQDLADLAASFLVLSGGGGGGMEWAPSSPLGPTISSLGLPCYSTKAGLARGQPSRVALYSE